MRPKAVNQADVARANRFVGKRVRHYQTGETGRVRTAQVSNTAATQVYVDWENGTSGIAWARDLDIVAPLNQHEAHAAEGGHTDAPGPPDTARAAASETTQPPQDPHRKEPSDA